MTLLYHQYHYHSFPSFCSSLLHFYQFYNSHHHRHKEQHHQHHSSYQYYYEHYYHQTWLVLFILTIPSPPVQYITTRLIDALYHKNDRHITVKEIVHFHIIPTLTSKYHGYSYSVSYISLQNFRQVWVWRASYSYRDEKHERGNEASSDLRFVPLRFYAFLYIMGRGLYIFHGPIVFKKQKQQRS